VRRVNWINQKVGTRKCAFSLMANSYPRRNLTQLSSWVELRRVWVVGANWPLQPVTLWQGDKAGSITPLPKFLGCRKTVGKLFRGKIKFRALVIFSVGNLQPSVGILRFSAPPRAYFLTHVAASSCSCCSSCCHCCSCCSCCLCCSWRKTAIVWQQPGEKSSRFWCSCFNSFNSC